jgi:hypothetical protein
LQEAGSSRKKRWKISSCLKGSIENARHTWNFPSIAPYVFSQARAISRGGRIKGENDMKDNGERKKNL